MIPKVIHYCWFGHNKKPEIVEKCIKSWHRFCPDYEIKCWDESNYDVKKCRYVQEAYESKNWAFVSDYARLDIIYHEGGIYLDTDVELIRSLDDLLGYDCFLALDGSGKIATGLGFGAVKGHLAIGRMLEEYKGKNFLLANHKADLTPCILLNSRPFLACGLDGQATEIQQILGAAILPASYFDPIQGETSELHLSSTTHGIHWYSGLWVKGTARIKSRIRIFLGIERVNKIKKYLKDRGIWIN